MNSDSACWMFCHSEGTQVAGFVFCIDYHILPLLFSLRDRS